VELISLAETQPRIRNNQTWEGEASAEPSSSAGQDFDLLLTNTLNN